LEISDGIQNLGGINMHLAIALFVSWLVVFAALSKGVQSLGKVSYFTGMLKIYQIKIILIHIIISLFLQQLFHISC
jgi:hypothetical protein